MQKQSVKFFLCLISGLILNSCFLDNTIEFQDNEPEYIEFAAGIYGFSGVCFNKTGDGFFAVSDKFGIYEINQDGSTKRKLPFNGMNDFEGITLNPLNGRIYVADEAQMKIFELMDDESTLKEFVKVNLDGGLYNKGIEGVSAGGDTLYVVNQEAPTVLFKFSLKNGNELSRKKVDFAVNLSDIFYSKSDHTLWITDGMQKMIFQCNLSGDVIFSKSIPYVAKPEAIVVDAVSKIAWVGCDLTGNFYRIKLKSK